MLKKLLFSCFLSAVCLFLYSRDTFIFSGSLGSFPGTCIQDSLPKEDTIPRIYEKVEVEASFPGGEKSWREFLGTHLNAEVPVKNGAPAGRYTVMIQFVVSKQGIISDIKALTNRGYGMEAEVIRILKLSPPWSPAVQNNRKVNAYWRQPITFQVIEEKKKRRRS